MTHTVFDGKRTSDIGSYTSDEQRVINALYSHFGNNYAQIGLYNEEAYLYRGVNIVAGTLAALPFEIRDKKTGKAVYSSGDEMIPPKLAWLEREQSFYDLRVWTAADLMLFNQGAYWYKLRSGRRLAGIKRILPKTVTPQTNGANELLYFNRGTLDKDVPFKMSLEDTVYFWRYSQLSEVRSGAAPASSASPSSGVLRAVDIFARGFFERGAIKPTILTYKGNVPPAEADRLESWWKALYSGLSNAWQTRALNVDINPIIVGEGLESLSNNDLTKERRQAVATALGVPFSIMESGASNRAVAEQDERNFYTQTIIPLAQMIATTSNRQLFNEAGYHLVFLPQKLSVFQEDEEQRASSFNQFMQGLATARLNGINPLPVIEALGLTFPNMGEQELFLPLAVSAPVEDEGKVMDVTPDNEAEPVQEDVPMQEDARALYADDITLYKRKALNALKRRKPAAVPFSSDLIPTEIKAAIAGNLTTATTPDEVRAAFAKALSPLDSPVKDEIEEGEQLDEFIQLFASGLSIQYLAANVPRIIRAQNAASIDPTVPNDVYVEQLAPIVEDNTPPLEDDFEVEAALAAMLFFGGLGRDDGEEQVNEAGRALTALQLAATLDATQTYALNRLRSLLGNLPDDAVLPIAGIPQDIRNPFLPVSLDDTTWKDIARLLRNAQLGLDGEGTIAEIEAMYRSLVEQATDTRGNTIGEDNAATMYGAGQWLLVAATSPTTKSWLRTTSQNPRQIHLDQVGVTVGFDQLFPDGSFWSNEPIGCKCSVSIGYGGCSLI